MTVNAHFDGHVFIPDEPVNLAPGSPVTVHFPTSPEDATPRFRDLLELGADLPDAPTDLASQHDHYLYGMPKR